MCPQGDARQLNVRPRFSISRRVEACAPSDREYCRIAFTVAAVSQKSGQDERAHSSRGVPFAVRIVAVS